jgi:hypothetical protein
MLATLSTACCQTDFYDYTDFKQHLPRRPVVMTGQSFFGGELQVICATGCMKARKILRNADSYSNISEQFHNLNE